MESLNPCLLEIQFRSSTKYCPHIVTKIGLNPCLLEIQFRSVQSNAFQSRSGSLNPCLLEIQFRSSVQHSLLLRESIVVLILVYWKYSFGVNLQLFMKMVILSLNPCLLEIQFRRERLHFQIQILKSLNPCLLEIQFRRCNTIYKGTNNYES